MVLAAGGGFVLKLFEMQTPLTAGIYRLCHRLFAATTLCKPVAAPPPAIRAPRNRLWPEDIIVLY